MFGFGWGAEFDLAHLFQRYMTDRKWIAEVFGLFEELKDLHGYFFELANLS